ncbi:MAG: hypothetical protein Q4P11_00290 [Methanobrevibacter sp.]|nr:hypothetical protein [Methanobrevibacter sp.]
MRIKEFTMVCNCGGHVSERTFNEFIKWANNVAEDMFDGKICVTDVKEDVIDVMTEQERFHPKQYCFKCPFWNKSSNYCTKYFHITVGTNEGIKDGRKTPSD